MSKHDITIQQILSGRADANIKFKDILSLLTSLGFEVRVKGRSYF